MISFTLTDNTGKKIRVEAPNSWHEITMKQLIQIEDESLQVNGLSKLFAILCGLEAVQITNSTDKTIFRKIHEVCEFVQQPPNWEELPCPSKIQIGEKFHTLRTDVNKLMHGQVELITELGTEDNLLGSIPKCIAIVMQPIIDKGEYDGERVEEIEKELMDSRGLECYGAGSFFFGKLKSFLSFGMSKSKEYQRQSIRMPKYYTGWLKVIDLQDIAA